MINSVFIIFHKKKLVKQFSKLLDLAKIYSYTSQLNWSKLCVRVIYFFSYPRSEQRSWKRLRLGQTSY